MTFDFQDDSKRASVKFSDGSEFAVIYKHVTDQRFILHYYVGKTNGGRLFTPESEGFQDFNALAECGATEGMLELGLRMFLGVCNAQPAAYGSYTKRVEKYIALLAPHKINL